MSKTINGWFDVLPRPRIFRGCAERPTFRSLGVAGYYGALIATLAAGLAGGRSLLVLAVLAVTCAVSFFAWAHLRRALFGRETLVLLEHVWVAVLGSAGVLRLLHEPVLPYLDAVAIGLAVFLAFGRVGCLLAGCCHGHPSSLGIRYGDACGREGFPTHLLGVRLFPVQAMESVGLFAIAAGGFFWITQPVPGRSFVWFLIAYSVLRFGLEGLRGDVRPHFFGLSQSRWMALFEFGAALLLSEQRPFPPKDVPFTILVATLFIALILKRHFDSRRRLLAPKHVAELRSVVRRSVEHASKASRKGGRGSGADDLLVDVRRTSLWVATSVSLIDDGKVAHVSIALPLQDVQLKLLCEVAVNALPELDSFSGHTSPPSLLHVRVPLPLSESPKKFDQSEVDRLFGAVVKRLQGAVEVESPPPLPEMPVPSPVVVTPAATVALTPTAPPTSPVAPTLSVDEKGPPKAAGDLGENAPWKRRVAGSSVRWRRVDERVEKLRSTNGKEGETS